MVKKKQIRSVEDPSDERPWYEVEIRSDAPYVVADKDGRTDFDMSDTAPTVPSFVDLPDPATAPITKDVTYAVTESGDFIAYEPGEDLSQHEISLRAHIGWYDSDTDEFTLLEFVDR